MISMIREYGASNWIKNDLSSPTMYTHLQYSQKSSMPALTSRGRKSPAQSPSGRTLRIHILFYSPKARRLDIFDATKLQVHLYLWCQAYNAEGPPPRPFWNIGNWRSGNAMKYKGYDDALPQVPVNTVRFTSALLRFTSLGPFPARSWYFTMKHFAILSLILAFATASPIAVAETESARASGSELAARQLASSSELENGSSSACPRTIFIWARASGEAGNMVSICNPSPLPPC